MKLTPTSKPASKNTAKIVAPSAEEIFEKLKEYSRIKLHLPVWWEIGNTTLNTFTIKTKKDIFIAKNAI